MAAQTLTQLIAAVRRDAQDASTVSPAVSDAYVTAIINDWYLFVYRQVEPRVMQAVDEFTIPTVNLFSVLGASTNLERIVQVRQGSSSQAGASLRIVPLEEIYEARAQSTTAADNQTSCALVREATTTQADYGKWRIFVHPPVTGAIKFSVLAESEAVELSAGADIAALRPFESRIVQKLAAADVAQLAGRPQQYVDNLLRMIPQEFQISAGMNTANARPRRTGNAS